MSGYKRDTAKYKGGRSSSPKGLRSETNKNSRNNTKKRNWRNINEEITGNQSSSHNSDFQNAKRRKNVHAMSFKAIEKLTKTDVNNVVLVVNDEKQGFAEVLKNQMSGDMIVLIIKVLRKICESTFNDAKLFAMRAILVNNLFMENLQTFICTTHNHEDKEINKNSYFWSEPENVFNDILIICESYLNKMPNQAIQIFQCLIKKIKVQISILTTLNKINFTQETIKKLDDLIAIFDLHGERLKKTFETPEQEKRYEIEPPNNFRDIPIFPTTFELTKGHTPFLRKNIVQGSYKDAEQYLDIQYRLLREDFIGPLRKGILDYMNPKHKQRPKNIRIYKDVNFLDNEIVTEDVCIRLQFEKNDSSTKNRQRKVNYDTNRRFMFGSLLCFTCDNFQSLIFGTVAKRDVEDLEKGQLVVGFKTQPHLQDRPYLMIECNIYFEPYYHVLNVLKQMNGMEFPMQRYILYVDTNYEMPLYLKNVDALNIKDKSVSLKELLNNNFYGLNDAQNAAFQAVFTQEFSIIQGPPGTGKTYLGLKIAETLLKNTDLWYKNSPILIICYTNHALDQFLEGILQFTQRVIRVGGQSKNETLKQFNVNILRKTNNTNFKLGGMQSKLKQNILQMKSISRIIKTIEDNDCILSFNEILETNNITDTWFHEASANNILDWLFEGMNENDYDNNYQQQRTQEPTINTNEPNNEIEELDEELNDELEQDDIFDVTFSFIPTTLLDLNKLNQNIQDLRDKERIAKEKGHILEMINARIEYERWYGIYRYMRKKLNQKKDLENMKPGYVNLDFPQYISFNDRWILYFNWLKLFQKNLKDKMMMMEQNFRVHYRVYEDLRKLQDAQFMRNALVIGMTTTGAARLQSSLQALKNPIVIVEEAAEVLEAHIITALTHNCQHLILIGDHQQLKPSTSDLKIKNVYKLGISLFERMVLNRINCYTLNIQHRMRPEISSLITPVIYPTLVDHKSVKKRSNIRGVEKNLFFIHHTESETVCSDFSKKNAHEAKFLIELARYLILNGYHPNDITILVAYLGQMFLMRDLKKKYNFLLKDVRICVLDNYQGEESKIILLSLVRNNKDGNIGFLKIENRVCVALSRARNGLFIMGNIDLLCDNSEIWPKVREQLVKQNALGTELNLRCEVHPNVITKVKNANDFVQTPEGGCNKLCDTLKDCGHICKKVCHVQDRKHLFPCNENCLRLLCENEEHLCKKVCSAICGPCKYPKKCTLKCGHEAEMLCYEDPNDYKCMIKVMTTLPCNHKTKKPCHENPNTYPCPFPCELRVEKCGHACRRSCHISDDPDHLKYRCRKNCAKYKHKCSQDEPNKHPCLLKCFENCTLCTERVNKKRKCGHYLVTSCYKDVNSLTCFKLCMRKLSCGHNCKRSCSESCGGCKEIVEKKVPNCDHAIMIQCEIEADRKYCQKKCTKLLCCGHKCTKRCCDNCTEICEEMVNCQFESPCGHVIAKIPCYLSRERN